MGRCGEPPRGQASPLTGAQPAVYAGINIKYKLRSNLVRIWTSIGAPRLGFGRTPVRCTLAQIWTNIADATQILALSAFARLHIPGGHALAQTWTNIGDARQQLVLSALARLQIPGGHTRCDRRHAHRKQCMRLFVVCPAQALGRPFRHGLIIEDLGRAGIMGESRLRAA